MRFLRVTGLALAAAFIGVGLAQATVIDNFNALPTPVKISEPFPAVSIGPILFQGTTVCSDPPDCKAGPILGGTRELQLINHAVNTAAGFSSGTSVKDIGITAAGAGTLTTTTGLDASLIVWWDGTNEDGVANNSPHTCPSGCSSSILSNGLGRSASGLGAATGHAGGYDITASAGANGGFIFDVIIADVKLDLTIILCKEGTTGAVLGDCIAHQITKPELFLDTFTHPFAALKDSFPFSPCSTPPVTSPAGPNCPAGVLGIQDGSSPILLSEIGSPTLQENFLGRASVSDAAVDDHLTHLGAIGFILRADVRGIGSIDLTLDQFHTTHAVPEPGTVLLMGSGLAALGLAGFVRRRRQQL